MNQDQTQVLETAYNKQHKMILNKFQKFKEHSKLKYSQKNQNKQALNSSTEILATNNKKQEEQKKVQKPEITEIELGKWEEQIRAINFILLEKSKKQPNEDDEYKIQKVSFSNFNFVSQKDKSKQQQTNNNNNKTFQHENSNESDKGDKDSEIFDQNFFDDLHTKKQLNFLDNESLIIYEYEEEGKTKGIAVSSHDLETIKYGQYLNDTIINFYLKFLENQIYPSMKNEIYIFQSYFMSKLLNELVPKDFMKLPQSQFIASLENFDLAYSKVQRWVKADIFKKKYLIIPLHLQDHWSLYIITNANILFTRENAEFEPMIIYFDSFGLMNKRINLILKKFLQKNYEERSNNNMMIALNNQELNAIQLLVNQWILLNLNQVPRQQNYIDCGLYLLAYTEFFLENPNKIETMIANKEFILDQWFPKSYISLRRYRLGIILKRIQQKWDLDTITKLELHCHRQTLREAEGKEDEFDLFDKEKFEGEFLNQGSENQKVDITKMKEAQLQRKKLDFYLNPQYANYEFSLDFFG